jgi:hypothetical protein
VALRVAPQLDVVNRICSSHEASYGSRGGGATGDTLVGCSRASTARSAPVAETRIPVTDEGPAARRRRVRGAPPLRRPPVRHGRPLRAPAAHQQRLRLEFDLTALRNEVDALLEEAGPIEGLLRIVLTRGGRRIAMIEPLPHRWPSPA